MVAESLEGSVVWGGGVWVYFGGLWRMLEDAGAF